MSNALPDGTVTILLVDDDEVDRMAVKRAFRVHGIGNPIVEVENGQEALEALRTGRVPCPYLVLLDLRMPVMDGHAFLDALRKEPVHGRAVVLVLTTSDHPSDVMEAYGQHVAGYVRKTSAAQDFLQVSRLVSDFLTVVILPDA